VTVWDVGVGKAKNWYRSSRRWLIRSTRRPKVGRVEFGDLERLTPISRYWGFDRGTPIDRLYIERFLDIHASDIRGRVLEFSNNSYTLRFGGERVSRSDVMHPFKGNPNATIIADLTQPEPGLENQFDCIICTQALQCIYEVRRAVTQLHQWLKPGGILLATVPGLSQISREDMRQTGDYWRFTDASMGKMFDEEFGPESYRIQSHGNVLAAVAFLHGIAAEECDESLLLKHDSEYQIILAIRAERQGPHGSS